LWVATSKLFPHITDRAEFWFHPAPPISVRYECHLEKKRNCPNLQSYLRWAWSNTEPGLSKLAQKYQMKPLNCSVLYNIKITIILLL